VDNSGESKRFFTGDTNQDTNQGEVSFACLEHSTLQHLQHASTTTRSGPEVMVHSLAQHTTVLDIHNNKPVHVLPLLTQALAT